MVAYLSCLTFMIYIGTMNNKYITRNKAYIHQPPSKDAKKVFIFCEGSEREYLYFCFFRNMSSNIAIIPIRSQDGKTDPEKLKEQAEKYFTIHNTVLDYNQNDEIWFAIDTDQWNVGNKIEHLHDFCDSKNALIKYTAWNVAQSNPSFEIWLYYHFFNDKPNYQGDKFKDFVNKSIPGGFDSRKHPVEIETAIKNSIKNYKEENGQPVLYSTSLHNLGIVIFSFVKEYIENIKKKRLN